jgi:HAD superfamily hydrolase (TIGR01509 family)
MVVQMAIEAVLFDFGDTLFYAPGGAEVLIDAGLEPAQAERLWAEMWADSKRPERLARNRDLSLTAHRDGWIEIFGPAEDYQAGLAARLYDLVVDTANWVPYPDVAAVLSELTQAGIRVGVVSNIPAPLKPYFGRHELDQFIDLYVESHEHGVTKPDPELFRIAGQQLGLDPANILVIGDNPIADGAAIQAGMAALILPHAPAGRDRGLRLVLSLVSDRAATSQLTERG